MWNDADNKVNAAAQADIAELRANIKLAKDLKESIEKAEEALKAVKESTDGSDVLTTEKWEIGRAHV